MFSGVVSAGPLTNEAGNPKQFEAFNQKAGFDTTASVGSIVALAIKAFLGLLGIIFIVLLVLAGYNWMTAYGDEQKVDKAKDTLRAAIIGLVIVVAAYSITYFVFQALNGATGGPGGFTAK